MSDKLILRDCSVELVDSMGNDTSVVNAARVSLAKSAEHYTDEQNKKLIKYLADHKHDSPFMHVVVSLRLVMPIWLARQSFKHAIGSAKNETSRRYVKEDVTFFLPAWREAPTNGIKQGSGGPVSEAIQTVADVAAKEIYENALTIYNTLLALGVAPEQARTLLPQGMMVSYIDTGSLFYWARVFNQRSAHGAQKDWLPLLEQINEIMMGVAPVCWEKLTAVK